MKTREDLPAILRFFVKQKKYAVVDAPKSQNGPTFDQKESGQEKKPSFFANIPFFKKRNKDDTAETEISPSSESPNKKESLAILLEDSDEVAKKSWFSRKKKSKGDSKSDALKDDFKAEVVRAVDVRTQIDNSLGHKFVVQFLLLLLLVAGWVGAHLFLVKPLQDNEATEARKLNALERETNTNLDQITALTRKLNKVRNTGRGRADEILQSTTQNTLVSMLKSLAVIYRVSFVGNISNFRDPDIQPNPENVFGAAGVIYRVKVTFTADYFDYLQMREQLYNADINFILLRENITQIQNTNLQKIELDLRTVELQQ